MSGSKPLGEVLVEERLISRDQLQAALRRQTETGRPLGKILLEMGVVNEESLVEAVSRQLGVPYIDLVAFPPSASVATLIPKDIAQRHASVPVEVDGDNLIVAMVEPTNRIALREIADITGYPCKPAMAVKHRIFEVIELAHSGMSTLDPFEDVLQEVVGPAPVHPRPEAKELSMHELLERLTAAGAGALPLPAGSPPTLRVRGALRRLDEFPLLQPAE